mmetsp:Transcript_92172/g.192707  ORF Transcript_92172/g.192707 Transcript_92172/m.192707 type:complete len:565 (-) Transcript_92172:84-1778(-)|eukprot:CAMPEP_0206457522 /NCGR_PEP_ID=MMETSP0324_2-20121206/23012_1 /ASSEMBLY_ACC=CAM_ASM_000836 /TAXON_ID=2866 /ORGANISM="Crypthecodinium cohnii, Strain Seligo" /LENGTH=564 /DNA_ID=CAMNT_0053928661 /DNA_START=426 /DNA_END=2120 /DNA_ORIENTATION=+
MLRWFSTNPGSFSASEAAAVEELMLAHQKICDVGRFTMSHLRGEDNYDACISYLNSIDKAAQALRLEIAPRSYRCNFSLNYKALFPDSSRHYRVDVLEASMDHFSEIWVNGEQFTLSQEARAHARTLQEAWCGLSSVLQQWQKASQAQTHYAAAGHQFDLQQLRPRRDDVAAVILALDLAWAQFECQYISELIKIEERARQHIVDAVKFDTAIRRLDLPLQGHEWEVINNNPMLLDVVSVRAQDRLAAQEGLVRCIGRLNSVANYKRKGRDDLGNKILVSALQVLQRCRYEHEDPLPEAAWHAAQALAGDVVDAYEAIRAYLHEVGNCLERVDPHLCNNMGLVNRLTDWEESWEVGLRYMVETSMLEAVCDLIAEVRRLETLTSTLTMMCENCDVELFLVLPRIALLYFVANPNSRRAVLVETLLPHHFTENSAPSTSSSSRAQTQEGGADAKWDEDVKNLLNHYRRTFEVLCEAPVLHAASGQESAWETLLSRAVHGMGEAGPLYDECPAATREAVEDLMRDIEKWSLELQRHCPEDWNQFSSVFVQCFLGGRRRPEVAVFQV